MGWTARPARPAQSKERAMRVAIGTFLAVLQGIVLAGDLPGFRERLVTRELKYGYQLVSVDLNGDGRRDMIAIDERNDELVWFENPGWTRHVMAREVPRQLNVDCWDYDGDGRPECALAYHFETDPMRSIGNLVILKAGPDVTQPWTMREIDQAPTAHRVRWIDWEGNGRKVLLLGPMVGLASRPPRSYADSVPLFEYRPPEFKRELVCTEFQGLLHAIVPVRWGSSKGEQLLTASFGGLHRVAWTPARWRVLPIAKGDPRPCPECGSSEARVGRLGKQRFLAAIEPWHGNQVVVYLERGKEWKRLVLDASMVNGHALAVGDLDGDGHDEIVAGFRGKGFQLTMYQAVDTRGESWRKAVLDAGGIAAADCKIEDFTGDGRPDIACVGASTANLKLFENLGEAGRYQYQPAVQ
jgi:hypothetical protein